MTKTLSKIRQSASYLLGYYEEKKYRRLCNFTIAGDYQRIYLYHVRKTAGKSLMHMMMKHETQDHYEYYLRLIKKFNHRIIINDKIFVAWHPILIREGYYYFAQSHLPFHEIKLPAKTFTIVCLRDPVERVISHYLMLVKYAKMNVMDSKIREEITWLGKSFSSFLGMIPKKHLLNQLFMFSKNYSVSEAQDNILSCNQVMFTDNFSEGIAELSTKIDVPLQIIYDDKNKIQYDISDTDRNRLTEMMEPEYRLIDGIRPYNKNNVFTEK